MLDVQYPRSTFPQLLFNAGSSPLDFPSPSHYWSEQSNKRRNISQDTQISREASSCKPSSSVPSGRKTTKSLVEASAAAVPTIDNMNGSGYNTHQTQYQGYTPNTSEVEARTYYATPVTLPQSNPSPHTSTNETRSVMKLEEPEFLPAEDLRANNGSNIASYLQLPKSICDTGGSLAQFAAETTCIFWFESTLTLQAIEQSRDDCPLPLEQMIPEAYPQTGFLKWVTTILSTTQVTQNVILMALSFIHRLKKLNPTVRGKLGSEYRLLTVALMLGNKFLDDNTYTNKTWAEVSGISVHEIHVMEMEFLSHLKYNLYMSKEEWLQWHKTLATCYSFLERLSKTRSDTALAAANSRRTSAMPYHLPSPPTSLSASPAYTDAISPHGGPYTNRPLFNSSLSHMSLAQTSSASGYTRDRKRSYEDDQEPPAKRQSTYGIYPSAMVSGQYGQPGATLPSLPTLPMPNMSMQAIHQQLYPSPYHYVPNQNDVAGSGSSRSAMSMSSQAPSVNWPQIGASNSATPNVQQQQYQHQQQPQTQPLHMYQQQQQQPVLHQLQTGTAMEPLSRHHTPLSARPGPSSAYPSQVAHSMIPNQLSPSYFLHRRSSPYRPVRNMHTLLNPPPSASMHRGQQNIPQEQMRWQPLGKNVEERAGRIPYYTRDVWAQQQQQQPFYPQPQPPSSAEFNFTPN